jgi:hypothetical protein
LDQRRPGKAFLLHFSCRRSVVNKFFLILGAEKAGLVEQFFLLFPLDRLGRAVLLHFSSRRSLVEQFFFIFL